jgi:hypothetical protein
VAVERILAEEPNVKVLGSAVHEISGGCGRFTVNVAAQEATPRLLPSVKFALTV